MKFLGLFIVIILSAGSGVALHKYILNGSEMLVSMEDAKLEGQDSGNTKPLYWVAPMDKNYRRDKPGKSPMGMDLVPVYEGEGQGSDEGTVKISPIVVNNLGVRTEKVTSGSLELPIETIGYVEFDEDRLTHIHSRVDGWIEVLNVNSSGDTVTKGQTLYELYSPALVNAQEEYLAALRGGNRALGKASKSRLLSLGLTSPQIARLQKRRVVDQRIRVIAEKDGFVKELKVRQGMFIKPAVEIMSIGNLDSVWVIAEVFERQSNWVKEGQKVVMTTAAIPGKKWDGVVDYLYPVLNKKTRTLRVRIRVDNPLFELKPNMYTDLTISAPVSSESLSIPREAVIKGGRFNRVVKFLGDGQFKSVIVEVGIETGSQVQILDGLSEGDVVVTSAQFLIDSESNIDAEIARIAERDGAESQTEASTVVATGKVNKVMPEMGMLSITHDPIEEWDWPTMKMDFQVDDDIELKKISPGQSITFKLRKTGDWDYLVTTIDAIEAEKVSSSAVNSSEKTIIATGKVKELMLDSDMITVVHDPIPDWQWPAMSMMFTLAEPNKVPELKPGDQIRFKLKDSQDGDYFISEIEPDK